jgi:hypothetical protein
MLVGMEEEFGRTVIGLFALIGFMVTVYGVSTRLIEPAWKDLKRRNPRLALRIVETFGQLYGLLALAMVVGFVIMVIYHGLLGYK